MGGGLISHGLKIYYARERPDLLPLADTMTPSFPSGHSVLSAVVYLSRGAARPDSLQTPSQSVFPDCGVGIDVSGRDQPYLSGSALSHRRVGGVDSGISLGPGMLAGGAVSAAIAQPAMDVLAGKAPLWWLMLIMAGSTVQRRARGGVRRRTAYIRFIPRCRE